MTVRSKPQQHRASHPADDRLIFSIHDAALSATPWLSVLESLCLHFSLSHATVTSTRRRRIRHGISADPVTGALTRLNQLCDWVDRLGELPENETAIYNLRDDERASAGPTEICHVMGADVLVGDQPVRVRLFRDASPEFSRADADQLQALLPHIATAMSVAGHIGQLEHRLSFHEMALNRVTVGLIIFAADGEPIWLNQSANKMIANGDTIRRVNGQVRCCHQSETEKLWVLVNSARENPGKTYSANLLRFDRESSMSAMAIANPEHREHQDGDVPEVGVFLWDLTQRATLDPKVLKELFGFTLTEVRLAIRLAEGSSIEEAALKLGIKPATVRVHLRSIYGKVGVHRQSELIRRILV